MNYKYDIFFSYKRDPLTITWHREVVKRIKHYVCNELNILNDNLKIFFDEKTIEAGDAWAEELGEAIKSSKCLVAVWSPEYFHSNWCLSEFRSFLDRQIQLSKKGLIIPASYHDGQHFPDDAKAIQFFDFSDYGSTIDAFWQSLDAVAFDKKIKDFSKNIASKISSAPPYKDNFPFREVGNNADNQVVIGRISNSV